MIWDSFFFTHPTSPATPASDKQFSKVFLKVVYLVVETFIWKSCVLGNQMPVLIHMRITRWFYKVHSLYKDLKNKKRVWRGGVWQMDPNLYILSEVDIFLWTLAFLLVNLQ